MADFWTERRTLFEGLLAACCRDLRELADHDGGNRYDALAILQAHELLASRLVVERPLLREEHRELLGE